jgi:outer membrane protein
MAQGGIMKLATGLCGTLLLAACGATDDAERWRYEQVLYEPEPSIRSHADAQARFDSLSEKQTLSLDDCYRMALHRSETLAIDGEELNRLQARFDQAVAAVLPAIDFRGQYTLQDNKGVVSGGTVQNSFTLRDRTEYKFTASQPIFSGFREVFALRQAAGLYGAREHALRHARLLLFADAADAFYAVLQAERELATRIHSLELSRERLEELVQRNRAGISRRSEALAQEAEVASSQAAVERLRGAHAVAWEALRYITGLREPRPLADTLAEPGDLPPAAAFVRRAIAERADLKALRAEAGAWEEGVLVARAGAAPSVALDATYYTHREGLSEAIDWDLALSMTVPLFDGGANDARVREARADARAAHLRVARLRRDIELAISRLHADALALRGEIASLETAVTSARETYEIVQAEYRRNIVTNLEVLAAFNTLEQATLARDRARFLAKRAGVRLSVESGALPGGQP